jgi:hypothetical protein
MQDPTNRNFYTVWEWYDAPYQIRSFAPKDWEKGTWIIRIEPGYGFPYTEFPVHNRPEWEVVQTEIDGRWYAFIRDPRNLPWPPADLKGFAFGTAATSDLPFSQSYPINGESVSLLIVDENDSILDPFGLPEVDTPSEE